jgi:hypothetical protein
MAIDMAWQRMPSHAAMLEEELGREESGLV